MDVFDVFALLLFGGIAWLWFDSLKARESAVARARAACGAEGLLLLDDTVAIARIGPYRDDAGTLRLRRTYTFEYSDTGNDRHPGRITLLGSRVISIELSSIRPLQGSTLH